MVNFHTEGGGGAIRVTFFSKKFTGDNPRDQWGAIRVSPYNYNPL